MRRSVDWTLEDNMVNGFFFCATLTGRSGGHTPFVKGAETPTPVWRRLSWTQVLLWRVIPGEWVPVWRMKMQSLVGLSSHSAVHWIHPVRRKYVVVVR